MEKTELWGLVLEDVAENVTATAFKSFIQPASLREINDNPPIAYIETPKEMITNLLKNRYLKVLSAAFKSVTGQDYKIVVKNATEYKEVPRVIEDDPGFIPPLSIPNFMKERIFDPALTFENFIIGDCNNYAAAVCRAIAESPFDLYNPLFIYGGSGLGKTHLLNAVGIYLMEHNPDIRILSISAETFTDDYVNSMGNKSKIEEFKSKYRGTDVLLIDDIQFFEGKEKTQEEFFHTFNTLLNNNKQIIISGDRPPGDLTTLDQRLQSRFLMKTTAKLSFPDYETRVAILNKDADKFNIEITKNVKEVINFIAESIPDNIRILKGAFENVVANSILLKQEIDMSLVRNHLMDIIRGGSVTPQKIKKEVCEYYGITLEDIDSETRKSNIAYPRQIAMYLCRILTNYSLPRIGSVFGNKHYSTVKHACDKIQAEISMDEAFKKEVDEIINRVKTGM